jgi:predicted CoA-binding protein
MKNKRKPEEELRITIWIMSPAVADISSFFKLGRFLVIGASADRAKFGNKVVRSYQQAGLSVQPFSKRTESIEGIPCVKNLADILPTQEDIGISIVTPPGATRMLMEEAYNLGFRNFFLQPGTHDSSCDQYISEITDKSDNCASVIKGCVLVELNFVDSPPEMS